MQLYSLVNNIPMAIHNKQFNKDEEERVKEQEKKISLCKKDPIISIYSLPFEGVGVKFIRIFKTNNCQLVYYKDVLELFQVVE